MAVYSSQEAIMKLTEEIRADRARMQSANQGLEIEASIKRLEKSNLEGSHLLVGELKNAMKILTDETGKYGAEQTEWAKRQVEELQGLAQSEEERREEEKKLAIQNSLLGKMALSLDDLGSKFDKIAGGLKKGLGFGAALGALALLFTDPETLFKGIRWAIESIYNIIEGIELFLTGDIMGGMEKMGESFGFIAGALGIIGILFGGKIIGAVSSLLKAAQAFRLFMMGSLIPTITGMFTSVATAVAPILTAALPFIAIGAAVAAAVYAIYEAFESFNKKLEETGSISDAIIAAISTFITAPLRWMKSLTSWVLELFGFDDTAAMLDDIDLAKIVGDWLTSAWNWVKGIFTFESNDEEEGFLMSIINDTIDKVKEFFQNMLDFLPSWDSIKNSLKGMLPDWLVGEAEETSQNILKDSAEVRAGTPQPESMVQADTSDEDLKKIAAAMDTWYTDEDAILEGLIKERDKLKLQQMKKEQEALKGTDNQLQYAKPVVAKDVTSKFEEYADDTEEDFQDYLPEGYTLSKDDRGNWVVTRPDGKLLTKSKRVGRVIASAEKHAADSGIASGSKAMMDTKAASGVGEYATPITIPVPVAGAGAAPSGGSVSSSQYNISQGVTSDDMVRRDFVIPLSP